MYRRSLVFSKSVILDVAGITPAELEISGIGALIYNLMDLPQMTYDDLAGRIVEFLSDRLIIPFLLKAVKRSGKVVL